MPYVIERPSVRVGEPPDVVIQLAAPWIGQYRLVTPAGEVLSEPNETEIIPVPRLGAGGFGTVVRAKDLLGLDRAVKIIHPDLLPQDDKSTPLFRQEITLTTASPLQYTVPILHFDHTSDMRSVDFQWYVMPFVPGLPLDSFWREVLTRHKTAIMSNDEQRELAKDLFLTITDQIFNALVELQDHRLVHMDISPSNILISLPASASLDDLRSLSAQSRVFLIDLGAAKQVVTGRTGTTVFIFHPYYFPEEIGNAEDLGVGVLPGRRYKHIRYEKLLRFWSVIDLYSLARAMEQLCLNRVTRQHPRFTYDQTTVAAEVDKEALWRRLLGDDFEFVVTLIDRMLQVKAPVYRDARTAREVFNTLRPTTATAAYDSLLLGDRYQGLRLRAGRSLVKVAPPLNVVVDHPVFQRLKRLNQLAFLPEVFPGATHSRFTHSLQAFDVMKTYLQSLIRRTDFRHEFRRRDVDLTLAAALLHDIGQYPFSHAIEDLRKLGDQCVQAAAELTDPEAATKACESFTWLTSVRHDQEVAGDCLQRTGRIHGQTVSIRELLERQLGIDCEELLYIIAKDGKVWTRRPALNIARDLMAGVIDSDRVSYLGYDSEQTGMPFGLAVDMESLVEGLTVRCDGAQHVGLGIEESAVAAVETVLASVQWMYRNVYWHHTNRAFMASVKFVMSRLLASGALSFERYVDAVYAMTDWEALYWLKTEYDRYIASVGTARTFNPLERIANLGRISYRRVYSLGWKAPVSAATERQSMLYRRLVRGITPDREKQVLEALKQQIPWRTELHDPDILVDIPLRPRLRWARGLAPTTGGSALDPGERTSFVWVRLRRAVTKEHTGWISLQEYSPLARAIADTEDFGRRVRVFVSARLTDSLTPAVLGDAAELMENVLGEVTQGWTV